LKTRGKWKDWEHISKLAPDGWKEQNGIYRIERFTQPSIMGLVGLNAKCLAQDDRFQLRAQLL
jgi:hypothetical protein